jgi:hydrogenase-4 component F
VEALLVLLPLAAALVAALVPSRRARPLVVPIAAVLHTALLAGLVLGNVQAGRGFWLRLDPLGTVILLLLSVLFAICSVYAVGYLRYRRELSNRIFVPCLLLFHGMTTLVVCAQHLGLMWVADRGHDARHGAAALLQPQPALGRGDLEVPAHRSRRNRARVARVVLPRLRLRSLGLETSLLFEDLVQVGHRQLSEAVAARRVRVLLVGYGTKMGLAPDAHVEARRLRRGARSRRRAAGRRRSRAARSSRSCASTRSATRR